GVEPSQDLQRLPERPGQPEHSLEESGEAHALERTDVDDLQRVARLGHLPRLDAAGGSDEEDVVAGMARLHFLAQRKAGEEVPARSSAGDEEPHRSAPAPRRRNPPGPPLTERRMPAAVQHATTDDTPYERNGSAIPLVGSSASAMPALTRTSTPSRSV